MQLFCFLKQIFKHLGNFYRLFVACDFVCDVLFVLTTVIMFAPHFQMVSVITMVTHLNDVLFICSHILFSCRSVPSSPNFPCSRYL